MAAIFSFGSFGDIITVIQILNDVRKTLGEGLGVHSEYQDAVDELGRFICSLQCLDRVQVLLHGHSTGADHTQHLGDRLLNPADVQQLQVSLKESERIATELQKILSRYDISSLTTRTAWKTRVHRVKQIVYWTLSSTRKKLHTRRNQLTHHSVIIQSVLIGMLMQVNIQEFTWLKSYLHKRLSQLPREPVVEFLMLIDLLDSRRPVPMHHCECEEDFHEYMLFVFKKRAGLSFIKRGDYSLASSDNDNVPVNTFQGLARPGATIMMAAIVRIPEPQFVSGDCPKCHKFISRGRTVEGVITCSYCGTSVAGATAFTIRRPMDSIPEEISVESSYQGHQHLNSGNENDIQHVRRIDVRKITFFGGQPNISLRMKLDNIEQDGAPELNSDRLTRAVGALAASTEQERTILAPPPSPASNLANCGCSKCSHQDQNPPINTLYVGNLSSSQSPGGSPSIMLEERLRELFWRRPGYRKLCFRQKTNGPMCFVEFEDVTHSTKAINELYGETLGGFVKGGIRLSYSKNPLGVRIPTSGGNAST